MKDEILEVFSKLPDKHAYLKQVTGKYEQNPDLWVKENILQSPLPVQEAFYRQLTEEYGIIADKIEVEKKEKEWKLTCKQVKASCIRKLQESDWTQLPDAPLSQKEKKAYREYRKWLRKKHKDVETNKDSDSKVIDYKEWKKSYDLYN